MNSGIIARHKRLENLHKIRKQRLRLIPIGVGESNVSACVIWSIQKIHYGEMVSVIWVIYVYSYDIC